MMKITKSNLEIVLKNPKKSMKDIETFAKEKNMRPSSTFQINQAWEDIEKQLLNGWSKKAIWKWLVDSQRFSYNYLTFLRIFDVQLKHKRKLQLEQQFTEKIEKKTSLDNW